MKKINKESEQSASEKKEILWNLINTGLAGLLVLLGALTTGNIDTKSLGAAFVAAAIVAITRFRDYWTKEESEYCDKKYIFKFL